jgi:glutamine amidotransferase
MLQQIGQSAILTSDPEIIEKADKLILPGVGSFDTAMQNLYHFNLIDILNYKVGTLKTPVFGICLGMQLFADNSEEGDQPGLGWIKGEILKFRFQNVDHKLKIPHMGWNTVKINKETNLFDEMPLEQRFYFVHSYYLKCKNEEDILCTTRYGFDFVSVVKRDNIIGVQFHPEKSHKFGKKIFENFVKHY